MINYLADMSKLARQNERLPELRSSPSSIRNLKKKERRNKCGMFSSIGQIALFNLESCNISDYTVLDRARSRNENEWRARSRRVYVWEGNWIRRARGGVVIVQNKSWWWLEERFVSPCDVSTDDIRVAREKGNKGQHIHCKSYRGQRLSFSKMMRAFELLRL